MTINKEQAVSDAVFERLDELVGYLEAMNQDRITHGGRVVFTSDLDEILSVAKAASHPLEQQAVSGDVVERVARALWLDSCDWLGWPNGQPTWDEMSAWPESDRNNRCEEFRSLAEAALTASGMERMREALNRAQSDLAYIERMPTHGMNDQSYINAMRANIGEAMQRVRTALQEEGVERRD